MRLFDKIAIIGVGLIGGSIGLAVKRRRLTEEVIGVFRKRSTMNKALKRSAVDRATMDIGSGVEDADLIILAASISSIPELARQAIRYAKKDAIITDVGSAKRWIIEKVEGLIGASRQVFFVGSHPMAGSERTSVEFARADLFEGSPCIVTHTSRTDRMALGRVVDFWKALGARVKVMTPASHDRSVSLISHLPHIVAFSLAGAVPKESLTYAAEGFKDTTRVASSDPELWADIFMANRDEILRSAKVFGRRYREILHALSKGSRSKLVGLLVKARLNRDRLTHGSTR